MDLRKDEKAGLSGLEKTLFLRKMNCYYLLVAVAITTAFTLGSGNEIWKVHDRSELSLDFEELRSIARAALGWYLLSRRTEILYSFLRDASDKLKPEKTAKSGLRWSERVRLALQSYIELTFNFALIFAMMPAGMWRCDPKVEHVTDMLWYSANVITTSGGSGFVPRHWALEAFTVYEIACGLILLVVCFTIYVGHGVAVSDQDCRGRNDAEKK